MDTLSFRPAPDSVAAASSSPSLPAPTASAPALPWWNRIETVWLLLAPLCALLYALCLPLAPNDLWYHVRGGEFLVRLGRIPTENGMSLGVPLDAPYYYQSWIAEWVMFQTVNWGGLSGLQGLRAACVGATFGLITWAAFRHARRQSGASDLVAARSVALTGILSLILACNNVDLRPQTFSVLLFGVWIWALGEFDRASARKRWVWGAALVGVMALWANTHGAFAVALITLFGWSLGTSFERNRARALSFWALLFACALSVCLNPRGAGIYVYLQQLSQNNIGQKYIQEWQSPGLGDWHDLLFWTSIIAALALAWAAKRAISSRETVSTTTVLSSTRESGPATVSTTTTVSTTEPSPEMVSTTAFSSTAPLSTTASRLVPLLLLAIMGARDLRSIIWFALFLPLVVAPAIAALWPQGGKAPVPAARGAAAINLTILGFLALLPLALTPQLKGAWPWPSDFRARFAPTPARVFPRDPSLLLDRDTPVEAAEFLIQNPPRGRIFTDMVCGSYLSWATYPRVRPWCEPRIEMFPDAFWEDYVRLSSGPQNVAQELEQRGFSDVLLNKSTQKKLWNRLKEAKQWQIVARGGNTILLRRKF